MEALLTGELLTWLASHTRWLGLAIFMIAMLESLAVAGLLIPGVLLLFAAAALAGGGSLGLLPTLAWAFAGAVCGDLLSFALGRWFHQDIRRLRIFQRHPQWIDRGESFFRRYGPYSIVLGRFIGPIRPIIPMVAGMFDMPTWRFLLVNVLSALAWAPVYVLPGYITGNAARWPVPESFWGEALVLLGGVAIYAFALLLILRTQKRWSSLAAAVLNLIALLLLALLTPRQDVLYNTLDGWLTNTRLPLLPPLDPLASEAFLWLSYLPVLGVLMLLRRGWAMLVLMTSALLCLALGLLPEGGANHLALVLTLLLTVVMLSNRQYSFWLRLSWGLYVLPLCALPVITWLTLPLSLPVVLASILQAACATLLAFWLVERAAPLQPLPRPWSILLPGWPLLAGALLLAGVS